MNGLRRSRSWKWDVATPKCHRSTREVSQSVRRVTWGVLFWSITAGADRSRWHRTGKRTKFRSILGGMEIRTCHCRGTLAIFCGSIVNFFFPVTRPSFLAASYVVLVEWTTASSLDNSNSLSNTHERLGGSLNSTRFVRTFLFHISRVCVHESSESCAPRVSSPPSLSPLSFFSFFFSFFPFFRFFVPLYTTVRANGFLPPISVN